MVTLETADFSDCVDRNNVNSFPSLTKLPWGLKGSLSCERKEHWLSWKLMSDLSAFKICPPLLHLPGK